MKITLLFLLSLAIYTSCKQQKQPDEIIIEGRVNNIPDGKLYLMDAHHWAVPLDSTICTNGRFTFKIKPDSSFVPYMAAIHFPDSSAPMKTAAIFYRNYMAGADSMSESADRFYVEKGYIRIEGDNKTKPSPRVYAGRETDVMLKNLNNDFGWIGKLDSAKRGQRVASFKKEIKQYPFSFFLLQSIYDAKEQYSKEELNEILAVVNADMRTSVLGNKFRTYLANRPDPNQPCPNLSLLDPNNQRHNIINPNYKLTMLIFWASWCGPCRLEIPELKKIQNKYKDTGLNLVSISIDENCDNWARARSQEQMPWTQFIVDKDKIDLVAQQFNFSGIPLVVFVDKDGQELKRFTGFEKTNDNYEAIIDKYIK